MKKIIIIIIFILMVCSTVFAQSFSQQLVSNGGDQTDGATYKTSWSIGEPLTATEGSTSFILSEGFQQNICMNPTIGGTIAASQSGCYPFTPVPFTSVAGPSNFTGILEYKWQSSVDPFTSWSDISGTNSPVYSAGTLSVTTKFRRMVRVNCQNNWNNAGLSNELTVTVYPLPVPTITGPSDGFCPSWDWKQYITESGNTNYIWNISSGGVIADGQGTAVLEVYWYDPGLHWVSVNYTTPEGCTAVSQTILDVNVLNPPDPAGPITGPAEVCAGEQNVPFSIDPIDYATYYDWGLPPGASIASGTGTNSIKVNFGENAVSDNITVSGNNVCGPGGVSLLYIVVDPLPDQPGTVSGPDEVCQGDKGNVYTVPVIPNATGYEWTLPPGGSIASGANTNTITVDYSESAVSGNVTVHGTNTCGSGSSSVFPVTVNPKPETPVVTEEGNLLTSSAPVGNQWYWNGTPVAGATDQTYMVPLQNWGWYWTVVTLENGCSSDTSNHVYIAGVGTVEKESPELRIFPVPNSGLFTVAIATGAVESFKLKVINILGNEVYFIPEFTVTGTHQEKIDIRNQPSGIYTVLLMNTRLQIFRKIIISK